MYIYLIDPLGPLHVLTGTAFQNKQVELHSTVLFYSMKLYSNQIVSC